MKTSKRSLLLAIQQLIAGIQKRLTSGSVVVANETYTGAQLVSVLQPLADALSATAISKAAYQKDVRDERDLFAKAHLFLLSLNQAIYASYGNAEDALADFGLSPRTRTEPTAAAKAAAADKARATKAARGEVGSKQREKIVAPPPGAPTPPAATGDGTK